MGSKKERARAANFSKAEEDLLLMLISSQSDIINCKKVGVVTNAMKTQAWKKVEEEFNAHNLDGIRDAGSLRTKYENFKRNAKKKLMEATDIVGGSEELIILEDDQAQLLQEIKSEATELQNKDDGNGLIADHQIPSLCMKVEDEFETEIGTKSCITVETGNEPSYNTKSLETPAPSTALALEAVVSLSSSGISEILKGQTPKQADTIQQQIDPLEPSSVIQSRHPELKTRKRNHPLGKISAWAASKVAIAEQEQVFKKELHEQKIRHLEEEHSLKIKLMEQKLLHAEEQQSWLRKEYIEKMKKINSAQ